MAIQTTLDELQHSVYTHIMIQGGPNPQLCVFLTKLLDFMDDLYAATQNQENQQARLERVETECAALAFHIIESLAVWLAVSLDDAKFPAHIQNQGKQLLVFVAKAKQLTDKLAAKDLVLHAIADLVRTLKATNAAIQYPPIKDVKNNIL
jgi:hypothetical protein